MLNITHDKNVYSIYLHSSNKPDKLSQWLCHDDSTINIVMSITNAIIIYSLWLSKYLQNRQLLCPVAFNQCMFF